MKSMTSAIEKLEGQSNTSGRIPITEPDDRRISVTQSRQSYLNGKVDGDATFSEIFVCGTICCTPSQVLYGGDSYTLIMFYQSKKGKHATFWLVNNQLNIS
nr:uncharacterized protein LOC104106935 [Nicotiana tomentosiformis]